MGPFVPPSSEIHGLVELAKLINSKGSVKLLEELAELSGKIDTGRAAADISAKAAHDERLRADRVLAEAQALGHQMEIDQRVLVEQTSKMNASLKERGRVVQETEKRIVDAQSVLSQRESDMKLREDAVAQREQQLSFDKIKLRDMEDDLISQKDRILAAARG